MVLTPDELALFDHGLSMEENPRSANVAAMKDLESIATFYSLIFRKPVGKHVILMCDSVSCWIMGCESVGDHLRRRLGIDLGQTTPDQRFTWLTIPCLGACDVAPAMMVDEVLCGPLTPELIDKIIDACDEADSS